MGAAYKGGEGQISNCHRILAEVIASDATWLMVFNRDRVPPGLAENFFQGLDAIKAARIQR